MSSGHYGLTHEEFAHTLTTFPLVSSQSQSKPPSSMLTAKLRED